jgi:hypothetical protein
MAQTTPEASTDIRAHGKRLSSLRIGNELAGSFLCAQNRLNKV